MHLEMIHRSQWPPRLEFHGGAVLTAWLHVANACNLRCPYLVQKSSQGIDD